MSARTLTSEILSIDAVDARLRSQLFALMQRCYDCVTRDRFEADLAEKHFLIVLRDAAGLPRGFSTQMIAKTLWNDEPIQVLFSGDTVIEPAFWGSPELVKSWCRVAAAAMNSDPSRRLFWFLISKGYRTYLFLPLFFRDFFPRYDAPEGNEHPLLTLLATEKFGPSYDPFSGIVRFAESLGHLTPELAEVPVGRQEDPHVRFFLERNPGYVQGEELACLAEISLGNTHGIGRRWLTQAVQEGVSA